MLQSLEVRNQLKATLEGRLSVPDLDLWLAGASWNAHRDAEMDARELVELAHLAVSDYFFAEQSETTALFGALADILNQSFDSRASFHIALEPIRPSGVAMNTLRAAFQV